MRTANAWWMRVWGWMEGWDFDKALCLLDDKSI